MNKQGPHTFKSPKKPGQKNKPGFKKKKHFIARLPRFISFTDYNSYLFSQFKYIFPKNKTYVIDFYRRAQVPVTYIDSSDEQNLQKYLNDHK